jgi:hypothetical protein
MTGLEVNSKHHCTRGVLFSCLLARSHFATSTYTGILCNPLAVGWITYRRSSSSANVKKYSCSLTKNCTLPPSLKEPATDRPDFHEASSIRVHPCKSAAKLFLPGCARPGRARRPPLHRSFFWRLLLVFDVDVLGVDYPFVFLLFLTVRARLRTWLCGRAGSG